MNASGELKRSALGDFATRADQRSPEKTAFIVPERDEKVTFSALNKRANRVAHALRESNLRRGDRIAIVGRNSPEVFVAQLGALKAGIVAVLLNHRLPPDDLEYQLTTSEARLVVIDDSLREKLAAVDVDVRQVVIAEGGDEPASSLVDFVDGHDSHDPDVRIEGRDPAIVMFTSGTTSTPKGVIHTHNSFTYSVANILSKCDVRLFDVQTGVLPLFHIHQNVFTFAALGVSATTVLHREFDPAGIISVIEEYEVTYLNFMSSMYKQLFAEGRVDDRDVSAVRRCVYGMPMEMELRKRVLDTFDAKLQLIAGQTEGGIPLFFDHEHQTEKSGNYVGRSGPFTDVAVIDEEGNILPAEETGEIVYRGPTVMKGFLNKDESDVWRDGWHHTKDIGFFDEDGLLKFVDRKKDIIKTAGENVSSIKVENAISTHPGVEECIVIGLPHDQWGEAVTAFVVPKEDRSILSDEIKEYAGERLAGFETPKSVEIVDEFPYTATGKIKKQQLVEKNRDYYS